MVVMWACPNKEASTDMRQVKAWFEEFKPQLEEEVDFPWWPQVLPLTVGEDKVADKNAKRLAQRLTSSWRWVKQLKGPRFCPPVPTILNIGKFLEESHRGVWMQEQWLLAYAHTL